MRNYLPYKKNNNSTRSYYIITRGDFFQYIFSKEIVEYIGWKLNILCLRRKSRTWRRFSFNSISVVEIFFFWKKITRKFKKKKNCASVTFAYVLIESELQKGQLSSLSGAHIIFTFKKKKKKTNPTRSIIRK